MPAETAPMAEGPETPVSAEAELPEAMSGKTGAAEAELLEAMTAMDMVPPMAMALVVDQERTEVL